MTHFRRFSTWTWYLIVTFTVLFAILLSLGRVITPYIQNNINSLDIWLEKTLEKPVKFGKIKVSWYGLGPAISINSLVIGEEKKPELKVKNLFFKISFFDILSELRFWPKQIYVDNLDLTIESSSDLIYSTIKNDWDREFISNKPNFTISSIQNDNFKKLAKAIDNLKFANFSNSRIHIKNSKTHTILKDVNLTIQNDTNGKHFYFSFVDENDDSSNGQLQALFKGSLIKPETLTGEIYVNLANLDLSRHGLLSKLPEDIKSAHLSTESWFNFKNGKLDNFNGKINFANLKVSNPNTKLIAINLNTNLAWQNKSDSSWILTGEDLVIEKLDYTSLKNQFRLEYSKHDDIPVYKLETSKLQLDGLGEIISLFAPEYLADYLSIADIGGNIDNLLLQVNKPNDWAYSFKTNFHDIAFKPVHNIPGFSGLNGNLTVAANQVEVNLNSDNLIFNYPEAFADFINLGDTSGKININKNSDTSWLIKSQKIITKNNNFLGTGQFALTFFPNDKPFLEASFQQEGEADILNIKKLLPHKLFTDSLSLWLKDSLKDGKLSKTNFLLRSKLQEQEFVQNEGVLEITAQINKAELKYHPDWPAITDINGQLNLDGFYLTANVNQASTEDLTILDTKIGLPAYTIKEPIRLNIAGHAKGDLAQGKQFVINSPLSSRLAPILEPANITGDMYLNLAFDFILDKDLDADLHLKGKLDTNSANFNLYKIGLPLHDINGSLYFNQDGLTPSEVSAIIFSIPLKIDIDDIEIENIKTTKLHTNTSIQIEKLAKSYPSDFWQLINGKTQVDIDLFINPSADANNKLIFKSDLKGAAINFPEPLNKDKGSKWPSELSLSWNENNLLFDLDINSKLKGVALKDINKEQQNILAKIVFNDVQELKLPQDEGIFFIGNFTQLDLQSWRDFYLKFPLNKQTSTNNLKEVIIKAEKLTFDSFKANEANIKVINTSEQINVDIESKEYLGNIKIPINSKNVPWQIELQRCMLTNSASSEKLDPKGIIDFDFNCLNSSYKDRQIGQMKFSVRNFDEQLSIDNILLSNKDYEFKAKGVWDYKNNSNNSSLSGELKFADIGKILKIFDAKSDIADSKGLIKFIINSKEPINKLSLDNTSGNIEVNLKNGRMTEIESGVGRVISLFNFENIQRRLRLDFSDVFRSGFSFDTLNGDFVLDNGLAYTAKTKIEGSSATIELAGHTDLINQSLDLAMTVMPHVSGALPLAATVATGNPAVGAVVWAVDKLFAQKTKEFAKYHYLLSGSWNKPKIERIKKPNSAEVLD